MESATLKMEITTKEFGRTTKETEKDFTFGKIKTNTKERGLTTKDKEKVDLVF